VLPKLPLIEVCANTPAGCFHYLCWELAWDPLTKQCGLTCERTGWSLCSRVTYWAALPRVFLQSEGHLQLAPTLCGQAGERDSSAKPSEPAWQKKHTLTFPSLLREAPNSDRCSGWVKSLNYTRVRKRNELPHHFPPGSARGTPTSWLDCLDRLHH